MPTGEFRGEELFQNRGSAPEGRADGSAPLLQKVAASYLEALLSGDRDEALRIIREDAPKSGLSIGQTYIGVIQNAQYEIGRLWAEGTVSVSQEHAATGIAQLAIGHLHSRLPQVNPTGFRILITCVPGEMHDMGPRVLTNLYELAGFEVRNLGQSVPISDIILDISQFQPDLIALSATMSYNLPAFRETVAAIRENFGSRPLITAGGQAIQLAPEILDELEVTIRANDARELVEKSKAALAD